MSDRITFADDGVISFRLDDTNVSDLARMVAESAINATADETDVTADTDTLARKNGVQPGPRVDSPVKGADVRIDLPLPADIDADGDTDGDRTGPGTLAADDGMLARKRKDDGRRLPVEDIEVPGETAATDTTDTTDDASVTDADGTDGTDTDGTDDDEEDMTAGGAPSPGTKKDRRLKENRNAMGDTADALVAETAVAQVMIDPANPGRFRSVLAVEEERTADNRILSKGATTWRDTPLPLMLMTTTATGHDGARAAGVIETITRKGSAIVGEGRFDTGDAGLEGARLVANGILKSVSIDAGDVEAELQVEEEDPETGAPTKVVQRFTSLCVMGATIVPFPAIGSAAIEYIAPGTTASADDIDAFVARVLTSGATTHVAIDGAEMAECESCDETVTAGGPIAFDAALFNDPELGAPTPVRVSPDGHVTGHLALWGTCHVSFPGACVTPPKSRTNYSHYLTGSVPTVDGRWLSVGTITMDTMHADQRLAARDAAQHYDHTGRAVAFVNVGEDAYGIWVAGVLKPGVTDEMATALCGASLSGDWRRLGGNLELVAVLGVNVPGFPIAHMRGREQTALVAAGYGHERATMSHQAASIAAVERRTTERVDAVEVALADTLRAITSMQRSIAPILHERLAARFAPSVPEPLTVAGEDGERVVRMTVTLDSRESAERLAAAIAAEIGASDTDAADGADPKV